MPRQPNGYPKIIDGKDGWYHAYVTVGRKKDDSLDRRHIKRRTKEAVAVAIDELRDRMKTGAVVAEKIETVDQWLDHWVNVIVKQKRAWKTWAGYRSLVAQHLSPALGHYRLAGTRRVLEPEHVEAMYAAMGKAGLSASYVLQAHRVLRRALKDAVRRGRASRNVCDLIDAPTARHGRIKAHTLDEAQKIVAAAMDDDLAARWYLGLMFGLRQGEALGLRWSRVQLDDDPAKLDLARQIQRNTYEHGCTDPVGCSAEVCARRPRCRTREDGTCARHKRQCPPPHPPGCTDHARQCKERVGGLVEKELKSEKGERTIVIDSTAVDLLIRQRERQQRELDMFGLPWSSQLHVFSTPEGGPIDPGADHAAWEALLRRAGVADSRLHAARHTAGTLMLATGTDIRVIQEILGHSRITVTERYVDVAEGIKKEAVDRVAALLFSGQLQGLLQPQGAQKEPPR